MNALLLRQAIRPAQKPCITLIRCVSTQTPPPARPYRPQTEDERAKYRFQELEQELPSSKPQSRTVRIFNRYFNPFHEPAPKPTSKAAAAEEPKDPARGLAAAEQVVRTGELDPRYRAAARQYTIFIIALTLFLGLTPLVYRRVVLGEKMREGPLSGLMKKGEAEGEEGERGDKPEGKTEDKP